MSDEQPAPGMTVREFADSLPEGVTVQRFGVNIRKERRILPTDAERAQARAEHLAAIADCFEVFVDDVTPVIRANLDALGVFLWNDIADLDEARAIRDRLAELIEVGETGGAV